MKKPGPKRKPRATVPGRVVSASRDGDSAGIVVLLDSHAGYSPAEMLGQRIQVTFGRERRSLSQNGYYWAVVLPAIAEAAGHLTLREADEDLRNALVAPLECGRIRRSWELTTPEFQDFLLKVQVIGAYYLGIYIPDPNEVPEWTTPQPSEIATS